MGVCWHSCTVCFVLDRALAQVHIPSLSAPSLASLTPAAPPAPPQSSLHPLQTPLDCSLTTNSCQQLFNEPPPPLPSFPITFLDPDSCVTHRLFHSTLVQPPPSQQVRPPGHRCTWLLWALDTGTKHQHDPSVAVFCFVSVCVTLTSEKMREKAGFMRLFKTTVQ